MVDEPGDVPADRGVPAPQAIDTEGPDAPSRQVLRFSRGAIARAHQLAGVIDDSAVLGNRLRRENPMAVHLRPAAYDTRECQRTRHSRRSYARRQRGYTAAGGSACAD